MAGRPEASSSAAAAGLDLHYTDKQHYSAIQNAQQANGHVDFSFRKRFEKVDWRKIGMCEKVFQS